ncbi:SMI1/KNR4 family protein [Sphingobacterium tabacisoli]|uniref:SMI1/KNR4 family protein n=1 Tax=Sphingobacterium tabacisoli TaxID=2044855 RepID=A0ABW5L3L9_9SPHI|nr:SMI1/KNR4 family protein [Sphingobacterium tabacisoli]
MTAELFNSLEILKEWIIKNEVSLSTSKWANGLEIIETEQLRFNIHPLSEEELIAIKVLTNNLLPPAYYHFLAEIGSGQFFINDYFPGFEIYNLAELKEYNQLIQQEIKEAGETIIDDYLMIGTHCSMGDWMGFCTTRKKEKNYDVFCHEYPIEEYATTSDELKSWRTFEEWIIKAIQTKGTETL